MHSKHLLYSVLMLFYSFAFTQEAPSNPFSLKWDNGFELKSQDDQFALKFGGSLMIDHAYFFQDDTFTENFGPLISESITEIRRARLFFAGSIYENTNFKIDVDFAGDKVRLKDVYIGINNIPVIGNLRIGHLKEPVRLSTLTSGKYTTLMVPAQNAWIDKTRNNGILLFNDFLNKRISAQVGTFQNADNNGYILSGRFTGLALRDMEKNHLLHLGLSYSYRNPKRKEYQFSTNSGLNLDSKNINIEPLSDIEDINLINFESAYIYGPFSFQGEYLKATINSNTSRFNFSNYYGEMSYFITGESKNYKGSYEGFGLIKPKKNFGGRNKGAGAWEIALRYSSTDLNDKTILGGKQSDFGLGLNWYLNPVTRLMLNHVWVNTENNGNASILQGRIQIEF